MLAETIGHFGSEAAKLRVQRPAANRVPPSQRADLSEQGRPPPTPAYTRNQASALSFPGPRSYLKLDVSLDQHAVFRAEMLL
jgi:hypothetical protein